MKLFLHKLCIFIAPIAFLSIPLDFFLSHNAKQSNSCNGEYLIWNDLYSSSINTDIAIYGSSKAWVGFNPKILEDSLNLTVYNLGIDGHNFWLQYLRHKELLKFNEKPRCIILNLDMFSLEKKQELYNMEQFLPYMLFNKNIFDYTCSYKGFTFLEYYVPLIRYAGKRETILNAIIGALQIPFQPMRIKGYRGMEYVWNNDFDNAKANLNKYEVKIDPATENRFETFLNECSKNNIMIVLVYSPEYIEFQKFITNRDDIMSLYEEFALKCNIPFLNYSDDFICKGKQYFYNSTHLNKTGAEVFSSELAMDLKTLKPYLLFGHRN